MDISLASNQLGTARQVNVTLPVNVAYDLDRMQSVVKEVLGQLGCPSCHSGFDLTFQHQLDFVADEAGKVRAFGLGS